MQLNRHGIFETRSLRLNVGGDAALVEIRTENGKQFLVSPVVAVIEKVLNGEFLSAEEIEKSVAAWEGIPITAPHPPENASLAVQNQFIARETIGELRNTSFADGKLLGEAWLDLSIAQRKAASLVTRIQNGETVEVSTGYFSLVQPVSGTHNGVPFSGVQTNITPWHFALLPDSVGACSVRDGCGLPRVNVLGDLSEQARFVAEQFFERFGFETNIEAVQDDAVIATKEGASFRVTYTLAESDGKQVVDFGDPEAGQIEFIPTTNAGSKIKRVFGRAWTGIKASLQSKEKTMDRKELVASIIENFGLCGEEALKLNDLPEAMLVKLNAAKPDEKPKGEQVKAGEKQEPEAAVKPPEVTAKQILNALGPERAAALERLTATDSSDRATLIEAVKQNNAGVFTDGDLDVLSIGALKNYAKPKPAPSEPVASYLGAVGPGLASNDDKPFERQLNAAYPGDIAKREEPVN
ncbi:MAG: DUF2213 domain-containing protein [Planctomycetes bacterium]|nr:DUF2213 domain-containing protein [Planctomycetota bacterium]